MILFKIILFNIHNKYIMQVNKKTEYDINKIITIQKYIRSFITNKHIIIPDSYIQTKKWRQNRKWYINGKHNECEKYQINTLEKILKIKMSKTNDRMNTETYCLLNNRNIINNPDGYEWTENFDGKIQKSNNIFYFNLKFVCDKGGSQTRTLREVYYFIKYQHEFLLKSENLNIYFINILDGDESYNNMNKFNYLSNKLKYANVKQNIFIGSLYMFQKSQIIKCFLNFPKHI
ncbi:hypothetical protein Hokovirus_1_236 [Hokovirus HKV1]|uniref:Uncharacterized protein n=1 Tax=Hokovirus HKV1 TaxID=1977638 RepID=A0A1V0SF62_9VIRU|nr:hypothetical protein Hokovirus_1_236 [Hokovirus HKV1]